MKHIITRSSIINRCNSDGEIHMFFTEKERPCKEAKLTKILDNNGGMCSRFTIELDTIEELDKLGKKFGVDVLVSRNTEFDDFIAIVLYDEEINQELL